MIKSVRHKGLLKFLETGSTAGVQAKHTELLEDRLASLSTAQSIDDMNLPGYRLHSLKGKMKGRWAIKVSGNWRLTFEFDGGDVHVLNYEDYH
ncbi:MAG: Killer protein [Leptolyngbya foveolarum]|uniref:Killer protein n=1 Tax=Leptolyngbya foveolarum TaxID=47253 RepID=A0A2W4TMI3_9CYAN|nr:MAG: Killer protein [Leptolyngbya foveolarum]